MSDEPFAWPEGEKGAVSFTYDDALPCHYEVVAPAWEAHVLQVTFPGEHQNLVDYVGGQQDSVWVAPLATIARHLRDRLSTAGPLRLSP